MKKIIINHVNFELDIPGILWDGWVLNSQGLLSPWGERYTPGSLYLQEWKSKFYDRQMNLYLPRYNDKES